MKSDRDCFIVKEPQRKSSLGRCWRNTGRSDLVAAAAVEGRIAVLLLPSFSFASKLFRCFPFVATSEFRAYIRCFMNIWVVVFSRINRHFNRTFPLTEAPSTTMALKRIHKVRKWTARPQKSQFCCWWVAFGRVSNWFFIKLRMIFLKKLLTLKLELDLVWQLVLCE